MTWGYNSLFWKENFGRLARLRGNGLWQSFGQERRVLLERRRVDIVRSRKKPECVVIASSRIYKHVTTPTGAQVLDKERLNGAENGESDVKIHWDRY